MGRRQVSKSHPRIDVMGGIDELNANLGAVKPEVDEETKKLLVKIQTKLFEANSEVADKKKSGLVTEEDWRWLEDEMERMTAEMPNIKFFVYPGGGRAATQIDIARTVCRRAERNYVRYLHEEKTNPELLKYLNRLSDYLFILARYENHKAKVEEDLWNHKS